MATTIPTREADAGIGEVAWGAQLDLDAAHRLGEVGVAGDATMGGTTGFGLSRLTAKNTRRQR